MIIGTVIVLPLNALSFLFSNRHDVTGTMLSRRSHCVWNVASISVTAYSLRLDNDYVAVSNSTGKLKVSNSSAGKRSKCTPATLEISKHILVTRFFFCSYANIWSEIIRRLHLFSIKKEH